MAILRFNLKNVESEIKKGLGGAVPGYREKEERIETQEQEIRTHSHSACHYRCES